ncbi:DUF2339 domain-containing protein [Fusobacterium sp. PH5-44]|uniref:DUF2339 domain-containing protein n=1 Tax=unclassified Fusobacterium TaxID=2648384 RepID=UPI003D242B67
MSDQIDKKKEIEDLVKRQRELSKSSQELLLSVEKIRDEMENSREIELYEENKVQKEKLIKLEKDFSLIQSSNKELKEKIAMLIDELKSVKSQKRNETISIFESAVLNGVNEDFEKNLIQKLDKYQKYINEKIRKIKSELPQEQKERNIEILHKLKEIDEEVKEMVEEEKEKVRRESEKFDSEIKLFTSDIEIEYNQKEDKYLYEKEKKNFGLEKIIGLKGFMIGGLVCIFFAILFGFREHFVRVFRNKYSRSVLAYVIGIFFIGWGSILYKKGKKVYAVGIMGGGIGVLYMATILSSTYFKLYPLNYGLFLAVMLTALTIVLSFKYDSQLIGIMALIGGYIPYGTSISLQPKENIMYLAIYSIILQFVVLAVSWKKNWKQARITGFVIGLLNTIFMMKYMYELKTNIYIIYGFLLAFTTMYSYVFLKGAEHENRKENKSDYAFLGINLFVKFISINILAYVGKISTSEKAAVFLVVGIIYLLLADRLKIYNLSKVFIYMGLASFIVVVPVLVPKGYLPLAWGAEAILIYILAKKNNDKQLLYGGIILYAITVIANIPTSSNVDLHFNILPKLLFRKRYITTLAPWAYFSNQIMVIFLSFGLYNIIFTNKNPKFKPVGYIVKYLALTKAIFDFIDIVHFIERKIKSLLIKDDTAIYQYKEVAKYLLIIFVVVYLLRSLTYKLKKYQDKFSIGYLVFIEVISTLAVYFAIPIQYPHRKVILFEPFLVTLLLLYIFIILREDMHKLIFKNKPKNIYWVFGEAIYIIFLSGFLLHKYNIPRSQLIINIIGLIICINLVGKGFKLPNKSLRRLGLLIGVIFTMKGIMDFSRYKNYRVIGYAVTGILLLAVSLIYQNALKKLESETPDDDPNHSDEETPHENIEGSENNEMIIEKKKIEKKEIKQDVKITENIKKEDKNKEDKNKEDKNKEDKGKETEKIDKTESKKEDKDEYIYINNKKYRKVKKKKIETNKKITDKDEADEEKANIFSKEEKENLLKETKIITKNEIVKEESRQDKLIEEENERIKQELEAELNKKLKLKFKE